MSVARQQQSLPWTVERLVEKGDRLMTMQNLRAEEAAVRAMPRDTASIPLSVLRTLAETGLAQRLGARESRRRYIDKVDATPQAHQLVEAAVEKVGERVAHCATVLASITYIYEGTRYSLFDMPVEGLEHKQAVERRIHEGSGARMEWLGDAVRTIRGGKVSRIRDLPVQRIVDLGLNAESVWRS